MTTHLIVIEINVFLCPLFPVILSREEIRYSSHSNLQSKHRKETQSSNKRGRRVFWNCVCIIIFLYDNFLFSATSNLKQQWMSSTELLDCFLANSVKPGLTLQHKLCNFHPLQQSLISFMWLKIWRSASEVIANRLQSSQWGIIHCINLCKCIPMYCVALICIKDNKYWYFSNLMMEYDDWVDLIV